MLWAIVATSKRLQYIQIDQYHLPYDFQLDVLMHMGHMSPGLPSAKRGIPDL